MKLASFILLLVICINVSAQQKITPAEAAQHIGDSLSVCGKVYGGVYLARTSTKLTLLNIGGAYPNAPFTVVIPPDVRNKFHGDPEITYRDTSVCVLGKIVDFKGKPQIVVNKPEQLTLAN